MHHGFPSADWNHGRKSNPGKSGPGTSLVFCRYQRVPDRASRVGPDYPGLQSERQAPRSRPLRGVLHILISSDQQWLETVPASSNSDRVRGVWISDWKKADLLTAPPYAARETLPSLSVLFLRKAQAELL